ncbi:MAG: hypothetical protein JJT87_12435 [Halomonas sp.]|nr:hypothetical protein [Halomonas sp.]MCC5902717.1 hypothetical protein [Halomonas sp.]
MHHCVGAYDIECNYLVFSIRPLEAEADKTCRATLGVFVSKDGAWIDQLNGPCNQGTHKAIQDFANHVIQALNESILEKAA